MTEERDVDVDPRRRSAPAVRPAELMRRAVAEAKEARRADRGEPDTETLRAEARAEIEAARTKSGVEETA